MSYTPIQTGTVIQTGQTFQSGVGKVAAVHIPAPTSIVAQSYAGTSLLIYNETQFSITYTSTYTESGTIASPGTTYPYSQTLITATNASDKPLSGNGGGIAFNLKVDSANSIDFAIGWDSPALGQRSAGIIAAAKPETGYASASAGGRSVLFNTIFTGANESQDTAHFTLKFSAAPGPVTIYTISQVLVNA